MPLLFSVTGQDLYDDVVSVRRSVPASTGTYYIQITQPARAWVTVNAWMITCMRTLQFSFAAHNTGQTGSGKEATMPHKYEDVQLGIII